MLFVGEIIMVINEILSKLFTFSFFFIELLLREGHFGHNTQAQIHTITYT